MSTPEELREALLNLDKARNREENQRQVAEALLDGLQALVLITDPNKLFLKLFDIMQQPLDFDEAFVLVMKDSGFFAPFASSSVIFADTVWHSYSMFDRVLAGQPSAVFDTEQVKEWRSQPEIIRQKAQSALHFAIHNTSKQKAIFVCTHYQRAHFSKDHISLARRFSALATQALQNIESEIKIVNLEEKLAHEAKIAELNLKLIKSEKKLQRARKMESLGLLAGGVAHDLNNVLAGTINYPELLLLDLPEDSNLRKPIKTIQESGHRAAAIVQDLLTVARGVAITRETLILNTIAKEYLLSPEFKKLKQFHSGITFQTNLASNLSNIKGSQVHIRKSIMNLVSNASEAIEGEGNVIISTMNRYLDKPIKGYNDIEIGKYAVLSISDNGPGISPNDLDRIFEPFYTKKVMGRSGTGLGLAVVWNTIQDHKGYIDVKSDESGTVFELYFPMTIDKLSDEDFTIQIKDYKGDGETILLVDDAEIQREVSCNMLTKLGYKAKSVSSGEDAVEYLKEHTVDLVLLDMIMDPGINGRETYERIIKIHPIQKAIIVSGFAESDEVKEAIRLGASQYVKKPFTLERIGVAVKEVLKK